MELQLAPVGVDELPERVRVPLTGSNKDQIGALSGVRGASAGLASGLVETMREIGGAVGIAVVTTVLVTRTNDGAGPSRASDRPSS
jgi:hypothetical protein